VTPSDIITAVVIASAPTLAAGATAFFAWRADKRSNKKLGEMANIGEQTNVLVNGQRLEMLVLVRDLRARIARENIDDEEAQLGLERAEKNLEEARLAVSATRHERRAVRKRIDDLHAPKPLAPRKPPH
jgi:hypothetical protein